MCILHSRQSRCNKSSLARDVWLGAVLLYSRKTYHKKKCGNQTSLKGTRVDIKKTLCVYVYLQQDSLAAGLAAGSWSVVWL